MRTFCSSFETSARSSRVRCCCCAMSWLVVLCVSYAGLCVAPGEVCASLGTNRKNGRRRKKINVIFFCTRSFAPSPSPVSAPVHGGAVYYNKVSRRTTTLNVKCNILPFFKLFFCCTLLSLFAFDVVAVVFNTGTGYLSPCMCV